MTPGHGKPAYHPHIKEDRLGLADDDNPDAKYLKLKIQPAGGEWSHDIE